MSAAAARIVGVETEYGLAARTPDGGRGVRISGGEAAARLFAPVEHEYASSNVFLPNGGRLYLDVGSHPEYATAECAGTEQLLVQERAGDELLARLAQRVETEGEASGAPIRFRLLKNNVDAHGNSYGCHENYCIARSLDLPGLAAALTPFLVTRQVLCGSGRWSPDGFAISQRAEVLHDELSSMTTRTRPLINTRDEPLADPSRFRRLHVISGDSNLSEPSAALKVGSLLAVLDAVEAAASGAGPALPALELDDVAGALRAVARDPRAVLRLASGRTIGALDVQREYLAVAGASPLVARWSRVLDLLDAGSEAELDGEVEWVTKWALLRRYADTRGLSWDDRRLAQVDLAFHELTRDADGTPRGLFRLLERRGAAIRLTDPDVVAQAMDVPPSDTRAALRGRLIRAARARGVRYSVDWTQLTVHDLPDAAGAAAEIAVRLPDPLAVADVAVDALLAALAASGPAISGSAT
ncbi:MAG: proteasome accessory factor PafA2 family protein [Micropruina sp.]|uniref:proteasome accessory factor PafA2 family protein n=1 Tax=Micropruina sp. TaxID=2737536 RepID=UPI0039E674F2